MELRLRDRNRESDQDPALDLAFHHASRNTSHIATRRSTSESAAFNRVIERAMNAAWIRVVISRISGASAALACSRFSDPTVSTRRGCVRKPGRPA